MVTLRPVLIGNQAPPGNGRSTLKRSFAPLPTGHASTVGDGPEMARGEGDGEPAGGRPRRPRPGFGRRRRTASPARLSDRPRRSARTIVFRTVAVGVAVVLTGGTLAAYAAFRHEWNGIKRVDVVLQDSFADCW